MLLNERTEVAFNAFIERPAASLIVAGSRYSGTLELIERMINSVLRDADRHSVLRISSSNDGAIGVEKIRELKQWLTTQFSNRNKIARMVIIESAELMTHEAQNALLKVLEEPGVDTAIILECSERIRLLDTIRSRCQILKVLPLSRDAALEAAKKSGVSEKEAVSAYALSGGDAFLFEQIIAGGESDIVKSVKHAKEYLKLSSFDRLRKQPDYIQSSSLAELLSGLARVCEAAMTQPASNVSRWAGLLHVIKHAEVLLERNTAPKLIYTYVSVNL